MTLGALGNINVRGAPIEPRPRSSSLAAGGLDWQLLCPRDDERRHLTFQNRSSGALYLYPGDTSLPDGNTDGALEIPPGGVYEPLNGVPRCAWYVCGGTSGQKFTAWEG